MEMEAFEVLGREEISRQRNKKVARFLISCKLKFRYLFFNLSNLFNFFFRENLIFF